MTTSEHYSFFPINHKKLDYYYQIQKQMFWTISEVDLSNDREDWDKLDNDTRNFLTFILAFFTQFDGIISENLNVNFQAELGHIKEARSAYAVQNCVEAIHNEAYSVLVETFIRDPIEKAKIFDSIANYPSIKKIADWAEEKMSDAAPETLIRRLISFACIEGVLFSGAFAAVYWIKRRKILNGLAKINEFIAREEQCHTLLAVEIVRVLTDDLKTHQKLTEAEVYDIVRSFIALAEEFIRDALKVDLIGINFTDMMSYIYSTADYLLTLFGYRPIYNVENRLRWMINIGLQNKSNFFEEKVSEYSKNTDNDFTFTTAESF